MIYEGIDEGSLQLVLDDIIKDILHAIQDIL